MKGTAAKPPDPFTGGSALREHFAYNGVILLWKDGVGALHHCSAFMAGPDVRSRWLHDGSACHDCPEHENCAGRVAALAALARHPKRTGAPTDWQPTRFTLTPEEQARRATLLAEEARRTETLPENWTPPETFAEVLEKQPPARQEAIRAKLAEQQANMRTRLSRPKPKPRDGG